MEVTKLRIRWYRIDRLTIFSLSVKSTIISSIFSYEVPLENNPELIIFIKLLNQINQFYIRLNLNTDLSSEVFDDLCRLLLIFHSWWHLYKCQEEFQHSRFHANVVSFHNLIPWFFLVCREEEVNFFARVQLWISLKMNFIFKISTWGWSNFLIFFWDPRFKVNIFYIYHLYLSCLVFSFSHCWSFL